MSQDDIDRDICRLLDALREISAPRPRFWRPPYGWIKPVHDSGFGTKTVAKRYSLEPAAWTINAHEDRPGVTAKQMLDEVVQGRAARPAQEPLGPGSVILMHDSAEWQENHDDCDATAELVRLLIEHVEEQTPWSFAPLDRAVPFEDWS